jgi:hypothetical protein
MEGSTSSHLGSDCPLPDLEGRSEDGDPVGTSLLAELFGCFQGTALREWKTPIFTCVYHEHLRSAARSRPEEQVATEPNEDGNAWLF